jgi:ferredoxin
MGDGQSASVTSVRLESDLLVMLLAALRARGYEIIAPTVSGHAVVYAPVQSVLQLPRGIRDEQSPGRYRLRSTGGSAYFDFVVGPEGIKRWLVPPEEKLWVIERHERRFDVHETPAAAPRRALIGVRACELAAMRVQDRVFRAGAYEDARYRARREALFVVAVNCGEPRDTCFCTSMGTGPEATEGFDLVLTEVPHAAPPFFVVRAGSPEGARVLSELPVRAADADDLQAAGDRLKRALLRIRRRFEHDDLPAVLAGALDHPHWDQVARRCLGCANCTLVCPTCFCSNVEDVTDLTGERTARRRVWDSCFSVDFSYLHGGAIRTSIASRYRQWLTHKLAHWVDQFGVSGCVGCGRCITWCPVGIDLTEEAAAIRAAPAAGGKSVSAPEADHGNP